MGMLTSLYQAIGEKLGFISEPNMKNDVFRVLGRALGLQAWQAAEVASGYVLPWVLAGAFARNTDPTIAGIQNTVRHAADTVTNIIPPIRWAKKGYQFLDRGVSNILAFTDTTLNRLPVIGSVVSAVFGSLEQRYKQSKNYVVLGPLWQQTVQSVLEKHLWNKYSPYGISYAAPYIDLALRYADQSITSVLENTFPGAKNYSLASLQSSWTGYWNSASTHVPPQELLNKVVHISLPDIEKLAESHCAYLSHTASQVLPMMQDAHQAIEQVIGQGIGLIEGGSNNLMRVVSCVGNPEKGLLICSGSALSEMNTNYGMPLVQFMSENYNTYAQPVLDTAKEIAKEVINKALKSNSATECVFIGNTGFARNNFQNDVVLGGGPTISGLTNCTLSALNRLLSEGMKMSGDAFTAATMHPYTLPVLAGVVCLGGTAVGGMKLRDKILGRPAVVQGSHGFLGWMAKAAVALPVLAVGANAAMYQYNTRYSSVA